MSDANPSPGPDIELADAIESVREQLIEAATRAPGRPLLFEVGDIEMEFTIELRKEEGLGAKVKAWVLEAGADAKRSTGRTHRVAFTLKPVDPRTGGGWLVGNEDAGDTSGFGADAFGDTGSRAESPAVPHAEPVPGPRHEPHPGRRPGPRHVPRPEPR
ncbi:trypco2 family protein [Streptomyces sp. NPDC055078]